VAIGVESGKANAVPGARAFAVSQAPRSPPSLMPRRSALASAAINKPFECRSAVVLSPSFRTMSVGYIRL
jgi:hypothetical protein